MKTMMMNAMLYLALGRVLYSVYSQTEFDNCKLLSEEKIIFDHINRFEEADNMIVAQNIYLKQDSADNKLKFIVSKAESVKSHSDRYELLHDYTNNILQFTQVNKVISKIENNFDFQVIEFEAVGYAPHGVRIWA